MSFWSRISKSFEEFKAEVGADGVLSVWKNWVQDKDSSIKNSFPGTYDRYDEKYGLHKKPEEKNDEVQ